MHITKSSISSYLWPWILRFFMSPWPKHYANSECEWISCFSAQNRVDIIRHWKKGLDWMMHLCKRKKVLVKVFGYWVDGKCAIFLLPSNWQIEVSNSEDKRGNVSRRMTQISNLWMDQSALYLTYQTYYLSQVTSAAIRSLPIPPPRSTQSRISSHPFNLLHPEKIYPLTSVSCWQSPLLVYTSNRWGTHFSKTGRNLSSSQLRMS